MLMRLHTSILILISFFIQATVVLAQSPTSITNPINISLNPENPRAGQEVSIKIESFSTDLNRAVMVWTKDGVAFLEGTGVVAAKIKAPDLGKTSEIKVSARTVEGSNITKSITIRPGDLDLVWETSGTVPIFYRGKAHPVYQNIITVSAIPKIIGGDGLTIDPKTLIYSWKNGSKVMQDQSGYGKQSVSVEGDIVSRSIELGVEVSSRDNVYKVSGNLTIDPVDPYILLFKNDPLYGQMLNSSIVEQFRFFVEETGVVAVPFGFDHTGNTNYLWMVNGFESPDLAGRDDITLRVKEGTNGSSNIRLNINNLDKILQRAEVQFTAYFNRLPNDESI